MPQPGSCCSAAVLSLFINNVLLTILDSCGECTQIKIKVHLLPYSVYSHSVTQLTGSTTRGERDGPPLVVFAFINCTERDTRCHLLGR